MKGREFICLGRMGHPVSRNLPKSGFQAVGFDTNAAVLVQQGGGDTKSVSGKIEDAEPIFSTPITKVHHIGQKGSAAFLNLAHDPTVVAGQGADRGKRYIHTVFETFERGSGGQA